jgi:hypothetical protein
LAPGGRPLSCAPRQGGHSYHRSAERPPSTRRRVPPCRVRVGCRGLVITSLATSACSQYAAHASISLRLFSSASPRRYACSALSPTACARAASATSRGNSVSSPDQSRKVEQKPCVVRSPRPILRSVINSAMSDSGLPALAPEKMCAHLLFMSRERSGAREVPGLPSCTPWAPSKHRPLFRCTPRR